MPPVRPQESVVELYLVDTSTETDVRVDLELIRAGHADPRPDSALAVSGPRPAASFSPSSTELDVRSLASAVALFGGDDASEVSASASEVVGRAPRRLAEWEPAPSAVSAADSVGSRRMARLRALHSRLVSAAPPSPPPPPPPPGSRLLRHKLRLHARSPPTPDAVA